MLKGLAQPAPSFDDELVDQLLTFSEGRTFEVKRVGENAGKVKTIVVFANTDGGLLVLGVAGEAVVVYLFNELRPGAWDQVYEYLRKNRDIGNAEVRRILRTDDAMKAYKAISSWVRLGLLVVCDPTAAKQNRRYRLPGTTPDQGLLSKLQG